MFKVNADTDHGRVVWAKQSLCSETSWPVLVISPKLLDLAFKEKSEKTWVLWLGDVTFSSLKNDLIFDFCDDFVSHVGEPTSYKLETIVYAIKIMKSQLKFEIPAEYNTSTKILSWAQNNLKQITHNLTGHKQHETYSIPEDIVNSIKDINSRYMELDSRFK